MGIIGKMLKKEDSSDEAKKAQSGEPKTDNSKQSDVKVEEKETKPVAKATKAEATAKVEKKPVVKQAKVTKKVDTNAYKVLSHPLISEKATDMAMENKYVFIVPLSANKSEIQKTVTNIYGVKPVSVNIMKKPGKKVRYGRRFGYQKDMKKAVVTLKPGEKIEVYEGV
jgi:large subunit ribosomal protein L23